MIRFKGNQWALDEFRLHPKGTSSTHSLDTHRNCHALLVQKGNQQRPQWNTDSSHLHASPRFTIGATPNLSPNYHKGNSKTPRPRHNSFSFSKSLEPPSASYVFWAMWMTETSSTRVGEEIGNNNAHVIRPPFSQHSKHEHIQQAGLFWNVSTFGLKFHWCLVSVLLRIGVLQICWSLHAIILGASMRFGSEKNCGCVEVEVLHTQSQLTSLWVFQLGCMFQRVFHWRNGWKKPWDHCMQ